MKKLRVLALIREGLEPPDSVEHLDWEEFCASPWKTEYDVVVTLEELGHQVQTVPVYGDLAVVRKAIEEFKPDIAFNLLEEFGGEVTYDQNVVAYLELMDVPYTGCNPRGLMIARDKALSKKLLAYHRIRVPDFAVFPWGRRVRRPKRLKFPLFVKSVTEDASLGISQASLVRDDKALAERVAFVHEHAGTAAIAEEFIEGRELYLGLVGNQRLDVFPPWEMLFEAKPEEVPLIATARAKWNLKYQMKWGVVSQAAKNLPKGFTDKIDRRSRTIFRILRQNGYARLDFRLAPDGSLYFLECNPNPALSSDEDYASAADKGGVTYPKLIQRILNLGLRWADLTPSHRHRGFSHDGDKGPA